MESPYTPLFRRLTEDEPFFSSQTIIRHIIDRCLWIARRADTAISAEGTDRSLLSRMEALSPEDRAFFVRSGPIRNMIEGLSNILAAAEADPEMLAGLRAGLCDILGRFLEHRASMAPEEAWERCGFDLSPALTAPLALLATPWRPADGTAEDEREGGWLESTEVQRMFDEAFNASREYAYALSPLPDGYREHLEEALHMLATASPYLLHDVTMNVRHIALVETVASGGTDLRPPTSFSYRRIPGVIFLSRDAYTRTYLLMELIYHESLHQKYTNLCCVEPIYDHGTVRDNGARFHCPWMKNFQSDEAHWPFERVFAAFHVYVHMAVLYGTLLDQERLDSVPDEWMRERLAVSLHKGAILRNWLDDHYAGIMGERGRRFYTDMTEIFDQVAAISPSLA